MVSPSLRQFLQSLCCNSQWDYAVLWKLQLHQGQALLAWDDGVFDISKPREHLEAVTVDHHCPEDRLFSTYSVISPSGSWVYSPIPGLVDEMSSCNYLVGKGVVGEVVHTETSCWIYAERLMCDGFNNDFKCPDELLHQFIAGIKTILLVPLAPYGVLQLGSLDKVAEDAELVTCVKNKFDADQQFAGYFSFFSSEREFLGHTEYISELSENAVEGTIKHISNIGDVDEMMGKGGGCVGESKTCLKSDSEFDVTELLSYPFQVHGESDIKQNMVDEDIDLFSYFTDYETTCCKNSVNEIMGAIPNSIWEPPVISDSYYSSTYEGGNNLLRFPSDFQVMSEQADLDESCSDFIRENVGQSSVCNDSSSIHRSQPLAWDCSEIFEESYKVEDLLEAVLTSASSISNDCTFNRSSSAVSLKASSGNLGSSDIAHVVSKSEDLVPCVTSISSGDKDSRKISPSESSFNCVINALLEEKLQRERKDDVMRHAKRLKVRVTNKKTRTGDKQKARPRDRQLIQDRIKALRELVPSSAKCSIDSLLEKTIKHMRFLRSVTDQADKVKHHEKDKKTVKSPVTKGNGRNRTSWAVELGGEQSKFPIIVKDLEYPGHMLIEMLCSDHGRFLEIADAIHRLDLTILKGLMEKRTDDCTWAHFIVEASGSFHRLDIFWPLMQLLQQN